MTLFRTVLLTSGLVLALSSGAAQAQPNAQDTPASRAASKPMVTLQMPALPAPVPVTLNPKTTALLVFDYVEPICNSQPKCKGEMLPAMTAFMARVRKAGMVVAYGTLEENVTKWLPEVAPKPGDIQIVNTVQDRFYNTDLDKDAEGEGYHDGHYGRLEGQRLGGLLIGRSGDTRLHRGRPRGYDRSRH